MGSNGNPNLTVREAVDRASAKVGERFRDQPVVEAAIRMAIGDAYVGLDQHHLAAKHRERAVELRQTHLGPHHPETLRSLDMLAHSYSWTGRVSDAIVIYERLLEIANARLGSDDPELLGRMNALATSYRREGSWQKAKLLFEQIVAKDEALRGPTEAGASDSAEKLAAIYMDAGMYAEAAAREDKVLALRKPLGSDLLGGWLIYQRAGRLAEAERAIRWNLELSRRRADSSGQIQQARMLEALSINLLLQDHPGEAEALAREALALYGKNHSTELEWRRPHVMNVLGGTLLGQKKYADAEPLLLQGYAGMKHTEATIIAPWRFRLTEAGQRVVRYFEETNQPEKAREWREKLKGDSSKR
jgi:tetratricopeptide (TPR) repeat protein